jgi:hypothetical protein
MDADKANSLKLEIWREIMRREPERNFNGMTAGGSLGIRVGCVEAATQALSVFNVLYPPTITTTSTAPKKRGRK